jgi:hypothetical protein
MVSMMVNRNKLFFGINCTHNNKQASAVCSTIETNPNNLWTCLIEECTSMREEIW